jgi:PKD repeat protein
LRARRPLSPGTYTVKLTVGAGSTTTTRTIVVLVTR